MTRRGLARRQVSVRRRVYEVLDGGLSGDPSSRIVHTALVALIVISVGAVVLETVPALHTRFHILFVTIEIVATAAFIVEYVLRLWGAVEHPPLRGMRPMMARLAHARSPGMIVDLLALSPFLLALVLPEELRALAIIRLVRFFKLARYSPGMRSLQEAIYIERRALLACLFILGGVMIMAAALMHLAEHQAQPERFGSIPDAMWWAIITLTTVGYGDVVPITPFGKLVAAITALCGLVMLALPVGIIATSFSEVIRRREFVVSWSMVARVPMFADLDARAMSELLGNIRSQLFEAGETILRKDDPPEAMFVIAEGAVEAIKGQRTLVLSVGDVFGELGVLIHRRRSMTVRARTRTRVLIIDADDLHGLFERHPGLREHLTAVTTARYGAETNASRNEDRA